MQQDITPSSYLPSTPYLNYPPTSISANVLTTASYAAGTSSVNAGPSTIFSWAHTVPTYMPWASKQFDGASSPPTTSSVVRFTAPQPCTSQTATTWELIYNLGTSCNRNSHSTNPHLKRRTDPEDDGWRPSKQYISEEKMAAKMGQLHISGDSNVSRTETNFDNLLSGVEESQSSSNDSNLLNGSDSDDAGDKSILRSFTLSEELKQLIKPDPFMVKPLLKEISICSEKPNMALVLWQPPGGNVKQLIRDSLENDAANESKKTTKRTSASAPSDSAFFPSIASTSSSSSSAQSGETSFQNFLPENNNNVCAENLNLVTNQRLLDAATTFTTDIDEEMELEL